EINSNDFVFNNEKLPAISASASIDKNNKTHLSLVNIDPSKSQEIKITISDKKYKMINGTILTSKQLRDYNSFTNPSVVQPKPFSDFKKTNKEIIINLPPFSVVVMQLE